MYIKELQNLGLGDKEAHVYLASLELGPETAQNIAKKAGVGRPSTYVQIELLKKKGLMSQFEQDNRTFFMAESPEKLKILTMKLEDELNARKSAVDHLVPLLSGLLKSSDDAPRVRFFEGEEALVGLRQEYLAVKNKEILGITNLDDIMNTFPNIESEYSTNRIAAGIHTKSLYTSKNGQIENFNDPKKLRQAKFIDFKDYKFASGITIFDTKVEIQNPQPLPMSVVIDDKQMADSFRAIFYALWSSLPDIDNKSKN